MHKRPWIETSNGSVKTGLALIKTIHYKGKEWKGSSKYPAMDFERKH